MEKVEKKLTRFRANLKNKRKLSLPMFINHFNQQWAENNKQESKSSEKLNDESDLEDGKQQARRTSTSVKGLSLFSANLISPTNNGTFGSLASVVLESDKELLKSNLCHSNSSSSSSSTSRRRSNSSGSSSSSEGYQPPTGGPRRQYATLPHSLSGNVTTSKYSNKRSTSTLPTNSHKISSPDDKIATTTSEDLPSSCQEVSGSIISNSSGPISNKELLMGGLASVYTNPTLPGEDKDLGGPTPHPTVVGTVSSPGGSTFTSFIVPTGE